MIDNVGVEIVGRHVPYDVAKRLEALQPSVGAVDCIHAAENWREQNDALMRGKQVPAPIGKSTLLTLFVPSLPVREPGQLREIHTVVA